MRINKRVVFLTLLVPILLVITNCENTTEETRDVAFYENLSYDQSNSLQMLDLRFPKAPDQISGSVNTVLLIHGGSWIGGDKAVFQAYLEAIPAATGCVVATMNYRTLFQCDDMLDDVESAIGLR